MIRLFCVYFDRRPIWKSDCVVPIQAGKARTGYDLQMLADDTGDNISGENLRYGEMTAWYWVWKNYLPSHPEAEYIGFCHYRRFLDFFGLSGGRKVRTTYDKFRNFFESHYNETEIAGVVKGYDLVMRKTQHCKAGTPRNEFVSGHPLNSDDWDRFEKIVRDRASDVSAAVDAALSASRNAQELQFVMHREVFLEFMEWAFGVCRECERLSDWGGENEGPRARTPAFLVERFFMVWLAIRKTRGSFRVKELAMIKLTGRPWWYRLIKPFLIFIPKDRYRVIYDKFK